MLEVKKSWHHLLHADIISLFVTMKCQKIQKIDEKIKYWQRKFSYLLKYLKNFNEIFRKD